MHQCGADQQTKDGPPVVAAAGGHHPPVIRQPIPERRARAGRQGMGAYANDAWSVPGIGSDLTGFEQIEVATTSFNAFRRLQP